MPFDFRVQTIPPTTLLSASRGRHSPVRHTAPSFILETVRRYRHLDLLTIGFVVVLLISNLAGPKICRLGPLRPSAAEFLFPLTYICGDVFTEVYGYGLSRRAIWFGFFAVCLLAAMGQVAVALPPAPEWRAQEAFSTVFGFVPPVRGGQPGGLLGWGVHQR